MKLILRIIGSLLLLFAIVAGFSSARDWLVLKNLSGYGKDHFTITGARVVDRTGDDGTDYYLQGHGEKEEYEFAISAARYEALSPATAIGQKITLFRNPSMPSLAFQKESVSVIFEDDWRDREEIESSAKSTLWIGVIAVSGGLLAFAFARSISPRRTGIGQGDT